MRRANHYLMLLAISHNPHTERPKDLWEELQSDANPDTDKYLEADKPDYGGLEMLKAKLSATG